MGSKTGISWTDATWNPWQGCTKVSDGCKNCYMYREKERYGQDPFTVVRSKLATFNAPLNWGRSGKVPYGSRIFVCSWSDFFHEDADLWRDEAWEIMENSPQYNFLIPTKRIERVSKVCPSDWLQGDALENVWLGISVENQETYNKRLPMLLKIHASVKWLSVEPMLGPINFSEPDCQTYAQDRINWVVFGGESGPNCRTMDIDWLRNGVNQCKAANVPVFVKQLGGWPNTYHELSDFPEDLRIREFPL